MYGGTSAIMMRFAVCAVNSVPLVRSSFGRERLTRDYGREMNNASDGKLVEDVKDELRWPETARCSWTRQGERCIL